MSWMQRTEMLFGEDGINTLIDSKVAVFGIGGVGSYAAEALARAGIGSLVLIDNDNISESNINRQLCALSTTVGKSKVEVMKSRVLEINPKIKVEAVKVFYGESDRLDISDFSYIVDAIDTVSSKLILIEDAKKYGISIISSMGAGNKIDPTKFIVTDIYKTSMCPLARVMRRELKKRNIESLKVVFSTEKVITPKIILSDEGKRQIPASVSFVPSVAGLICAGEVVKDLVSQAKDSVQIQ